MPPMKDSTLGMVLSIGWISATRRSSPRRAFANVHLSSRPRCAYSRPCRILLPATAGFRDDLRVAPDREIEHVRV